MKIFLYTTTTGDRWEMCGGSYLVIATDLKHANELIKVKVKSYEKVTSCAEISLDIPKVIEIQESIVE